MCLVARCSTLERQDCTRIPLYPAVVFTTAEGLAIRCMIPPFNPTASLDLRMALSMMGQKASVMR